MTPMRRVLMVAYHFPPLAGSSGIQRTLRFVQHLPQLGWQPLVLSADPRAYERSSPDLLPEVPAGTVVRRAFALDTARQLAWKGRYLGAMARPDRWMSWRFDGVRQGLQLIREFQPQLIWSTYPIPTAHRIALELARRSGLPWIADFRDPMAQDDYPTEPKLWAAYDRLERQTVAAATRCVFTTPGAARVYRQRYPDKAGQIEVIENGYDEESFARVEASGTPLAPLVPGAITLLHSGVVYPQERDPTQFFEALARLLQRGEVSAATLRVRFRASGHDPLLHTLAERYGARGLIETLPPTPYAEALQEMRAADGLLLMQGLGCNEQIPAKSYEYLRAGRPILGLADPVGDTAGVLRQAGLPAIHALHDADAIEAGLRAFLASLREGRAVLPEPAAVRAASRQGRSEQLARLLDSVAR
jgi:glycosyltransferase involved in cell wall biosynthesis